MIYANNKNLSDSLREKRGGRLATWTNNLKQQFFPMFSTCPVAFSSTCWALGEYIIVIIPIALLFAYNGHTRLQ